METLKEKLSMKSLEKAIQIRLDKAVLLQRNILRLEGTPLACSIHHIQHDDNKSTTTWKVEYIQKTYEDKIWRVSHGRNFSVYIQANGKVYVWGDPEHLDIDQFYRTRKRPRPNTVEWKHVNTEDSALFVQMTPIVSPYELVMPRKVQVRQIASGLSHCCVLTDTKRVFVWGIGMYGQLGLDNTQQVAQYLTPIQTESEEFETSLKQTPHNDIVLRCGPYTSSIIVGGQTLWLFGLEPSQQKIKKKQDNYSGHKMHLVPTISSIASLVALEDGGLQDAGIGLNHVVLLSKRGNVWTYGHGELGELGVGPKVTASPSTGRRLTFFSSKDGHSLKIRSIAVGFNHTLAIAEPEKAATEASCKLFAWGSNEFGQCGAKTRFNEYFTPVNISLPDESIPTRISCCFNTSSIEAVSTDKKNKYFQWGICYHNSAVMLPEEVNDLHNQDVYSTISAPGYTEFILGNLPKIPLCLGKIHIHGDDGVEKKSSINVDGFLDVSVGETLQVDIYNLVDVNVDVHPSSLMLHSSATSPTYGSKLIHAGLQKKIGNGVQLTVKMIKPGETRVHVMSQCGQHIFGRPLQFRIVNCSKDVDKKSRVPDAIQQTTQFHGISVRSPHLKSSNLEWYPVSFNHIRALIGDKIFILAELPLQDKNNDSFNDYQMTFEGPEKGKTGFWPIPNSQNFAITFIKPKFPGRYFVSLRKKLMDGNKEIPVYMTIDICKSTNERKNVLSLHKELFKKYCLLAESHKQRYSNCATTLCSFLLKDPILREFVLCSPLLQLHFTLMDAMDFDRVESEVKALSTFLTPEHNFSWDLFEKYLTQEEEEQETSVNYRSNNRFVALNMTMQDIQLPVLWDFDPPIEKNNRLKSSSRKQNHLLTSLSMSALPQVSFEDHDQLIHSASVQIVNDPQEYLAHHKMTILGKVDTVYAQQDRSPATACLRETKGRESVIPVACIHDDMGEVTYLPVKSLESNLYGETDSSDDDGKLEFCDQQALLQLNKNDHGTENKSLLRNLLRERVLNEMKYQSLNIRQLFTFFLSQESIEAATQQVITIQGFTKSLEILGLEASLEERFATFSDLDLDQDSRLCFGEFKIFLLDPSYKAFWREYLEIAPNDLHSRGITAPDELLEFFYGVRKDEQEFDDLEEKEEKEWNVPWETFARGLRVLHIDDRPTLFSCQEICRLLYRFDTNGNGQISIFCYVKSLSLGLTKKKTLWEHDPPSFSPEKPKRHGLTSPSKFSAFRKSTSSLSPRLEYTGKKPHIASKLFHRGLRPKINDFQTPNAVYNLFLARANVTSEQRQQYQEQHQHQDRQDQDQEQERALHRKGNTTLAKVRSLPVSKLLREGIYFRGKHGTLGVSFQQYQEID